MGDRRPGGGGGGRKVLLPPINFIFKLLQQHNTVQIWLYEQLGVRIEGKIRGFDEFMNLVIDDAVEVKQPGKGQTEADLKDPRRELGKYKRGLQGEMFGLTVCAGQILLKGDNVALIQSLT